MRPGSVVRDLLLCVGDANRRQLLLLYCMMFLAALIEALSAALFVPFTSLLMGQEAHSSSDFLGLIYIYFNADDVRGKLLICAIVMVLVFFVKNIYMLWFVFYKSSFIRRCHAELAMRLLDGYLRRDYLYHVQRSSSTILRNINQDVGQIFAGVFPSVLSIMVDGLMSGALLALILWSMPWQGWMIIAGFGALSVGAYRVTQRKNAQIGAEQRHHSGEMVKWAIQGLGSIKETKVMNKEDYFLAMFRSHMMGFARTGAAHSITRELPRQIIELCGVVVMLGITLLLAYREQESATILPTLSLFAVSTFRMLPALNRITSALSSIRFYRSTLRGICQDLTDDAIDTHQPRTPPPTVALFSDEIELREVCFRYPEAEQDVLSGLSLSIKRGESVALVGSSGAGKTTAVDVLLGLLRPRSGQLLIDGSPLPEDARSWQQQIGYISQPIYLLDDSVRRNVAFGSPDDQIDEMRVWAALRSAQLDAVVRELPQRLDTRLGEAGVRLSGGQRQRIGIARVLYRDPPILIFDEATSALDPATELEITQAIEGLYGQKTILIIAHRLGTIRRCDKIIVLDGGAVAAVGTFDELYQHAPAFRRMVQLSELSASSEVQP